jgi:hypothetical protein
MCWWSQTILPRVPGRDFAGVVEAAPDGWMGVEVWGSGNAGFTRDGSHAQYIIVPVTSLCRKPQGLSFDEAASVGVNYLAAQRGLVDAGALRSGETFAIIGVVVASGVPWPKSRGAWGQARSLAWIARPPTRQSQGQRTHSLPVHRTLLPPCVMRSAAEAQTWCSMPWGRHDPGGATAWLRRW